MRLLAYDHVGIRVTDRARSLHFYKELGFEEDPQFTTERVAEIVNKDGVRINLIFNGEPAEDEANVLLDRTIKWPGYTHAAFIVDELEKVLSWARSMSVEITEGPVDWGRRYTCFVRDPDNNVLEFNQLKTSPPPLQQALS